MDWEPGLATYSASRAGETEVPESCVVINEGNMVELGCWQCGPGQRIENPLAPGDHELWNRLTSPFRGAATRTRGVKQLPFRLDNKRFASYCMRSGMAAFFAKIFTLNRNFMKSVWSPDSGRHFFNVHALGNNMLQNIGIAVVNTKKD